MMIPNVSFAFIGLNIAKGITDLRVACFQQTNYFYVTSQRLTYILTKLQL